ncbi:MAG: class II fructose-bisphosphatase [Dehalococcoidales bacterium]|jgi:fructose-1,6-bisphosphatase II|nr:class II fructose-bisphosphatase [Dehalococcoidales bacterium]
MMESARSRRPIERNIAMELVRATEAAAMAAARFLGRGNKELVDQAAVDAMRLALGYVSMDGIVVIGEGEKDEAPMLYIGEHIGGGSGLQADIAVDPVDGTTLVANGLPGAISAVALSARGTINCPRQFVYMDKLATGPEAKDVVDINAPVAENLKNIARAKKRNVSDLTVVVLDRPRHEQLLSEIRSAGARVKLIPAGDLAAGIHAALPETGVDVLLGVGGTPEGVLTAAAIQCIGGTIQCKAWPRDDRERDTALKAGIDLDKVYYTDDLINSDDVFFAATGVSTGELLEGVRYFSGGAATQSLAMRSSSGTVRWVDAHHNFDRLDKLRSLDLP